MTSNQRLQLLIVEDSEDDAELIRLELEKGGFELIWSRVETEEAFLSALDSEEWDVIVSDYAMPNFNGLRAFNLFREKKLDIPFIFVSGALGEERAVEAMRAGARDYMLKGNLSRLQVAVRRELQEAENRRQRRAAEEANRREQRRLAVALEATGAGVFEYKLPRDPLPYYSEPCATLLGYSPHELPRGSEFAQWLDAQIHPQDLQHVQNTYKDFLDGRIKRWEVELRMRHKEGGWRDIAYLATAAETDSEGRVRHVVGVMMDRTSQKMVEAQLRHAQKMEAVGRLAGGVAHDFNNLLTAIFNFGSFVLETLSEGDAAHEDMQQVLGAAQRAQNLTRQLLAFSRQQPINPRLVNSNTLVIDIEKLLRRLLGEDIDYATRLETDLWGIRIDPGAFEQVLVNLAINSRDAMPCGGRLVVGTSNVEVDEALAQALGFNAPLGQYMVLTVIDTGIGMDLETQKRIFDPFFTTKETGKGTGLGLATCYGIVKQAGGFIHVESEPNQGTTFKVFLPRFEQSPADQKGDSVIPTLKGTETILVVEDDRQVLEPTVRTLSHFGYRVLQASSGEDALRLCAAVPQPIHLLLSDIVMPKMSGPELVQHIAPRHPEMKVLYMSGYAGYGAGGRANASVPQAETLEKPFTPQILARRIREVLDSGK